MEERYADAQDGPGAVAGGGDDWKQSEPVEGAEVGTLKRARSPEDETEVNGERGGPRARMQESEETKPDDIVIDQPAM
jgi:nuclear cap-binding protein subunit 2